MTDREAFENKAQELFREYFERPCCSKEWVIEQLWQAAISTRAAPDDVVEAWRELAYAIPKILQGYSVRNFDELMARMEMAISAIPQQQNRDPLLDEMAEALADLDKSWTDVVPDGPDFTDPKGNVSIAADHKEIWRKIRNLLTKYKEAK